jgi:hypothetical protein
MIRQRDEPGNRAAFRRRGVVHRHCVGPRSALAMSHSVIARSSPGAGSAWSTAADGRGVGRRGARRRPRRSSRAARALRKHSPRASRRSRDRWPARSCPHWESPRRT